MCHPTVPCHVCRAYREETPVRHEITSLPALTLAGVNFTDAGKGPALIMYAWIRLAAIRGNLTDVIEPHTLYGVWHRTEGAGDDPRKNAYFVGLQVSSGSDVPEGVASLEVPASRYLTFVHEGHVGLIGRTYDSVGTFFREGGAEEAGIEHAGPEYATLEVYDTRQDIADAYTFRILEAIV